MKVQQAIQLFTYQKDAKGEYVEQYISLEDVVLRLLRKKLTAITRQKDR